MEPTHIPESAVAAELAKQLGTPRKLDGYMPFVLVPGADGATALHLLEREAPAPLHFVQAKPTFRDVVSFISYVNRFKDERLQVFADERKGTIVAVFDYHEPAPDEVSPQRCAHVAIFTAEATPEWTEWRGKNGKAMSQEDFAGFVEDQAPFITRPDAATMLEIATSMQASSSASFSKAIRLDNGQVQLQYVENIDGRAGGKGSLEIPKTFDVALRPFVGCEARKVEARLRYRIDGGRLAVWFDLFRAEDIQRDAFEAILLRVSDEVQVKPYIGAP